ncbi:MAG: glycosyltransferase family 4 protein [Desulfamplus sp.]|nr:glycosyltransferase family 4 protein [Desulfamplus sp.]MBF0258172.1 glycosyltransferase family 4 protein [Desulfamplus sp.]
MHSRLKIGIISYRSNPHCGGQGVYVRNLSRALTDLGHNVEVIAGPPDPLLVGNSRLTLLQTLDLYNPDDLFRTPKLHELQDPVNLIEWLGVSSMGYPEPLTFGMRAKRYLKDKLKGFDIIHDNQCLAYGILSLSKQIPVTATIHHPMTVDRRIAVKSTKSIYKKFKHLRWYSFIGMQKYVARRLPKLITVSDFSKQDISKEFSIPENRFVTIPNGINTELFHPMDHIKREPSRLIVTNSADTPLKGLFYLLHAIKGISAKRAVKLIVIGSPKKNGGIEKLVKNLELQNIVQFTGRIDDQRFIEEYARATLAIVPSLYEGFGLPVGEAMACRIPVICTNGGALPEVAGDAAKIVPQADAVALKNAIVSLLDNPQECERMAQAGYDRVMKNYTWQMTAIKTAQVYKDIIHSYR